MTHDGARPPAGNGISRRRMITLSSGSLVLGSASLALGNSVDSVAPIRRSSQFSYPFLLGIASGDPWADSVVLWTRLVPDVYDPYAMPDRTVNVEWQVANDEYFNDVVADGTAKAFSEHAHSVHVEVFGLQPGRWYFYRFRAGGHISEVGRTRTAPPRDSTDPVRFVSASCQSLPDGYFNAYRHIRDTAPDFVMFLGDWIYESDAATIDDPVRSHDAHDPVTLDEYRFRHAQYRLDPDLQAASAVTPYIVTFDDHEIVDNWFALTDPNEPREDRFEPRRKAAFRAFYEHLPLRAAARPSSQGMKIHRRMRWGNMLDVFMLDTRQYRSATPCGGGRGSPECLASAPTQRSMLGSEQERWLHDGMLDSEASWRTIGQQIPMGRYDYLTDPNASSFLMDRWDGYPQARNRLLEFIRDNEMWNVVVLSGDAHAHMATDLTLDMADPWSTPLASDMVCTSISTTGDGSGESRLEGSQNPHLRFSLWRRGYIEHYVDQDMWLSDFRTVPYVSKRGAPRETATRLAIENGNPGLQEA